MTQAQDLVRVANEQCLPFDLKVPNGTTRCAIGKLEAGKGQKFGTVADMMVALDADD